MIRVCAIEKASQGVIDLILDELGWVPHIPELLCDALKILVCERNLYLNMLKKSSQIFLKIPQSRMKSTHLGM